MEETKEKLARFLDKVTRHRDLEYPSARQTAIWSTLPSGLGRYSLRLKWD